MLKTGERYLPGFDGADISYEHWHRYLFATQFVAGKNVLDIASGEGYGSALLARTATTVVGVDLDDEAVDGARKKYPLENLTFHQGSAEAVPLPGRHLFDVVTSFETLEHLTADTQRNFMTEVKRLLTADGYLIISTPNRTLYTERPQFHNPFHLHELNLEEYVEFLGTYFGSVRVFCQHVYPCSYIWGGDPTAGTSEYQLGLVNGQYQPVFSDRKEQLYLIAVCSDVFVPLKGNSLLLDLDRLPSGSVPENLLGHVSTLFVDSGSGFRAETSDNQLLPVGGGEFRLTFDLNGLAPVLRVRWDPLELRTCRVRVDRVEWEDGAGLVHHLDVGPQTLAANGEWVEDGVLVFDTVDPMVFLPVAGDVARLTVVGWYEVDDLAASLARIDAAARGARIAAAARDEQLQALDVQSRALDGQTRELATMVAERDARVRELAVAVAERDARTQELVAERDARVRELAAVVAARDEQLQTLDAHARAIDEQVRELSAVVTARDAQLQVLDAQRQALDEQARAITLTVAARDEQLRTLDGTARELAAGISARDAQLKTLADTLETIRTHHLTSTVFVDTGSGFHAEESRSDRLPAGRGEFRLTFDLRGLRRARRIRWDPLELRTCRVRVDRVEWEDIVGRSHRAAANPQTIVANGEWAGDGVLVFDTGDPRILLPVTGDVARLTIVGWYEADDLTVTLARMEAAVRDARALHAIETAGVT